MIVKEFRELRRDRRTIAMLIALPVMLLIVFGYAANFNVSSVKTEVIGPQAAAVRDHLPSFFDVTAVDEQRAGEADAEELLRDAKAAVVVDTSSKPAALYLDGSDLFSAQSGLAAVAHAPGQVEPTVLFNPELKTSWFMVPALIGMILAMIGTIITSIGLVRESEAGTLEQLAVMPLRAADVIVGKIAPYFVLACVDMALIAVVGVWLFGVPFRGNVAVFALGAALFLFVVLGLGVLISTLSQTQGQAIQMAFMMLMPQIMFSGMIFPLAAMPWAVRWIGYLLPLTYFNLIVRGIMIRGTAVTQAVIWQPLVVLAGMAVVVFALAVLRFRAQLRPGRASKLPSEADHA